LKKVIDGMADEDGTLLIRPDDIPKQLHGVTEILTGVLSRHMDDLPVLNHNRADDGAEISGISLSVPTSIYVGLRC
jgi:hypothetical protein